MAYLVLKVDTYQEIQTLMAFLKKHVPYKPVERPWQQKTPTCSPELEALLVPLMEQLEHQQHVLTGLHSLERRRALEAERRKRHAEYQRVRRRRAMQAA
jgi:hypothetical protein